MNVYSVPPDLETLGAIQLLSLGVAEICFVKDSPHFDWCRSCYLRLHDGRYVHIQATGVDLEFKFEVFPLFARIELINNAAERQRLNLEAPVVVTPLETETWLDPAAPTGEAFGIDPIAQFIGRPGAVTHTASATCRYVGAVELRGANGERLLVATGTFPYSLHVSGHYEDEYFRRDDYAPLAQ